MSRSRRTAEVAPEHRLLLTAALADVPAASAAWREWRATVDFDSIDGAAQRLLPLIVRRQNVIPSDDPVRGRVRGMYRQTWVNNHRLWSSVQPLLDALGSAGVRPMVLKGIALLSYYGDDWGVRPMFDVDVAIPFDSRDTALDVVHREGWTAETGQSALWVSARIARHRHAWGHERVATRHRDRVDLHWRVSPSVLWPRAQEQWWRNGRTTDVGGRQTTVIGPVELLVHVLVHGTTGDLRPPVQWIVDAVHVAREVVADPSLRRRWAQIARAFDLVGVLRDSLDTAIRATGDESLVTLRATLPRRRSLVDRARGWRGPGTDYVAQWARAAAGGAGLWRGAFVSLQRLAEIDVVARPRAAMIDTVLGNPIWLARLRRRGGAQSLPPLPDRKVDIPCVLDLTRPETLDHHAGPGWRMVGTNGAATFGRTSSLVLTPRDGREPLELTLTMQSIDEPLVVTVVVDGRRLRSLTVGPERSDHTMSLPHGRRHDRDLEIRLDVGRRRGGVLVSALRMR